MKINVTFEIDENGVLIVAAEEKGVDNGTQISIENVESFSEEDIDRMIQQAEQYQLDDQKQKETVMAKNELESYCYTVEEELEAIPEPGRTTIEHKILETMEWTKTAKMAEKSSYEERRKSLKAAYDEIINQMNAAVADDDTKE